jgi:2,4'-dihydroxyacetophenone dioxygenase
MNRDYCGERRENAYLSDLGLQKGNPRFASRSEHDWVAKPGTFIYEPAGEAHTLVITDDSPEPAIVLFVVSGGLIYLDKPEGGAFAAYEDGFSALELCRAYYRKAGLDVSKLDELVR